MASGRKKICVFCSSSPLLDAKYIEEAREFGSSLARAGFDMVFGGVDKSSMGALAHGAYGGGAIVHGIVTRDFLKKGLQFNPTGTILTSVEDLEHRKRQMQKISDAFVLLPGAIGSLDEFFTVMANHVIAQREGLQVKPICILNARGIYNNLFKLLSVFYEENLAGDDVRRLYQSFEDSQVLIKHLQKVLNTP